MINRVNLSTPNKTFKFHYIKSYVTRQLLLDIVFLCFRSREKIIQSTVELNLL